MSMVSCPGCNKELHQSAISCPQCGAQQVNPYRVGTASLLSGTSVQKPGFFGWYTEPMKKYAEFSGRATRQEYWMFFLLNTTIALVISFIANRIHLPWLSSIYSLAMLIPGLAMGVRRMHDTDHSGWWLIVPFVGLVFACFRSHPEANRFGPARVLTA